MQFRMMFWISRGCFYSLCQCIIRSIGERQFKSESYIDTFLDGKDIIFNDNIETTGSFISGEAKLAIAIRLLAGGDALYLVVIFNIHSDHCTWILYDVLLNWVIVTGIGDLNTTKYLGGKDTVENISRGF